MAEDQEGLSPQEAKPVSPERVKTGVRERVVGVLNEFINQNPVVREQSKAIDRIHGALPEGRVKDAVGLAVDAVKVPQALFATTLEWMKMIPGVSFAAFIPEKIGVLQHKAVGFIGEKIAESAPVQAGVRTVDAIMDGILGERKAPPPKATLENARQVLVGMARPGGR
jgi:hypothetical protein